MLLCGPGSEHQALDQVGIGKTETEDTKTGDGCSMKLKKLG